MELRKVVVWSLVGLLMAVAIGLVVFAFVEDQEPPLTELMQSADQVVVVTPQENLELKPGNEFEATVKEVFRGTLKPQASVRVFPPVSGTLPTLLRDKPYVLLLRKSERSTGYDLLGRQALLMNDQTIRHMSNGQTQAEWSIEDFRRLLAQNGLKRPVERRDALTGRWLVIVTRGMNDVTPLLLEFGNGNDVKILDNSVSTSVLKSAKVAGNAVELEMESQETTLVFRGRLQDGAVRGELQAGEGGIYPIRLEPTQLESLGSIETDAPGEGAMAYRKFRTGEDVAPFEEWLKAHPESPVGLAVRFSLLELLARKKADPQALTDFSEEYARFAAQWGPMLEMQARLNIGVTLTRADHAPEVAMQQLDAIALDKALPYWKAMVKRARGELLLEKGQEAEGLALLQEVLKESPLDVETMVSLAGHYESDKVLDKAIEIYADLAVIPGLAGIALEVLDPTRSRFRTHNPRAIVDRLWREKHGGDAGLAAYLKERYEARVPVVRPERVAPRPAAPANRVSLIELFTGATCEPCIAADLACESLSMAYAPSELIILQHHVNVPGPDPLTNEHTEARFKETAGEATPMMLHDGAPVSRAGGPTAEMSSALYDRLRADVEKALKVKAPLTIALTARSNVGRVKVEATVRSPQPIPSDHRLRVVLAEEKVEFDAPNGIRTHHNVVRYAVSGLMGIPAQDGKLALAETVDLNVIKKRLSLQMAKLAQEYGDAMPRPVDFKSFLVVAYVTNEDGDVLQAAAVPVAGLP